MTEEEGQPGTPRPKVLLILEDSEDHNKPSGLVKDYQGSMPVDENSEGWSGVDTVGYWSRYGKGTFYVSLMSTVDALQDILIGLLAELRANPVVAAYPHGIIDDNDEHERVRTRVRRPATAKVPEPAPPSVDFSNLRARLGR